MKNFALIGAAGYIAPRHMKSIKDVGGNLVACLDPHDSVGILDSYFPDCKYFREFEVFDRYCENHQIDYVSICSPNYLHEAHSRFALRIGADAICEKPSALKVENIKKLIILEKNSCNKIWPVLQLRHNPDVIEAKRTLKGLHTVHVEYITPRGEWYNYSWKGEEEKSGGLATNIGVHLFDLATYLFGKFIKLIITFKDPTTVKGELFLEYADVSFSLSTKGDIPKRVFKIEKYGDLDLSNHFKVLHTTVYENAINKTGFSLEDTIAAIDICERIRNA